MNILVRNLHRGVTENDLLQLFKPFGTIKSHNIVIDQSTGKSKGFGFVDMPDNSEAAAAIKTLDGKLIRGLKIRVKAGHQPRSPFQANPAGARPERFEAKGKRKVIGGKPGGVRSAKRAANKRK